MLLPCRFGVTAGRHWLPKRGPTEWGGPPGSELRPTGRKIKNNRDFHIEL